MTSLSFRFGTVGSPISTPKKPGGSVGATLRIAELNLSALELGWVRENACELSDEDYLRMILKKTCWYTCIHPCRIGGLIGSGGAADLDRFNRFGYFMGSAFQIQDDLLNLVGDEDTLLHLAAQIS